MRSPLVLAVCLIASSFAAGPASGSTSSTSAGTYAGAYRVFTSDADFNAGKRHGVVSSSGALKISTPAGTRSYLGKTYEYGTWTSPWVSRTVPANRLVPSWTATTPTGTWVQVLAQVRDTHGNLSTIKDLGRWASGDSVVKRTSGGEQADPVARVDVDTLVARTYPWAEFRLLVRLMRRPGDPSPSIAAVGAVTTRQPSTVPATSKPLSTTPVSLDVPRYSQMVHEGQNPQYGGGGEAWCSPTSLSMVLGYYGRLPASSTYSWVSSSYSQRWVNGVARSTYDYGYEGTGNWPFNAAYAATRVSGAFVTRLADLRMAERVIRAGIPLIVSIKFSSGGLNGAPISSTAGHLVVLRGFTAAGNAVVNDPAAPTSSTVRRTYNRAQFETAWLRGSAGMAYVLHPSSRPLPPRPAGTYAW